MSQLAGIIVSILALVISVITAWLTLFRRGTVKMTRPTTIYFGADGSVDPTPKVYLRTLLYSTAKRGQIVESMYVKLSRGESIQTFNIWVYGEMSLARGSGLYVGENGISCDHHFLLPADGTTFSFLPGEYNVEVYASLVGISKPILLSATRLPISDQISTQLQDPENGVYFDWGPDSENYHPHIRTRAHADRLREMSSEPPPRNSVDIGKSEAPVGPAIVRRIVVSSPGVSFRLLSNRTKCELTLYFFATGATRFEHLDVIATIDGREICHFKDSDPEQIADMQLFSKQVQGALASQLHAIVPGCAVYLRGVAKFSYGMDLRMEPINMQTVAYVEAWEAVDKMAGGA